MIIREMTHSDIERVKEIATITWKDTYRTFIPLDIQERTLKEAYSKETMNKRFKSSLMLVAERDNEIIGYAFFSGDLKDQEVFLESLYVHPQYQGEGVGKQLYLAGIKKFENPMTISLTVYKGNPNLSFYKKEGFKAVNETKGDFCGHPITFIKMNKNLENTM